MPFKLTSKMLNRSQRCQTSKSCKIDKNSNEIPHITVIDLKNTFGQIRLHEDTAKHCVIALVRGKLTGQYQFKNGFYGLANMLVKYQEQLDKTLSFRTPVWRDYIIIVTGGSAEEHYEEVTEVLSILEQKKFRASLEKSKFFLKTAVWCGFETEEDGIRLKDSKAPLTLKEVRSFFGGSSISCKILPKLIWKDATNDTGIIEEEHQMGMAATSPESI